MSLAYRRYRWSFFLPASIGAAVFAVLFFSPLHLLVGRNSASACAPLAAFIQKNWPGPHLAAAALALSLFVLFLFLLFREIWNTDRHLRSLRLLAPSLWSNNLSLALHELQISRQAVAVFEAADSLCFSAGFFRPKIYLSSGAIKTLNDAELLAVLSHENRHRRYRDPARSTILRSLGRSLFFVPVIKLLEKRFAVAKEILADADALKLKNGGLALAGALYKLSSPGLRSGGSPAEALAKAGQVALALFADRPLLEIRISYIAGQGHALSPLKLSKIILSAVVISALLVFSAPGSLAKESAPSCASLSENNATTPIKQPAGATYAPPDYITTYDPHHPQDAD
ncbi:M56 family peptidase [Patescibacteria group bacterium]|nr:MAG: M56 family peptidase [Patescibacteria group bacterium]